MKFDFTNLVGGRPLSFARDFLRRDTSFMQKGGEYFTPASIVKLIVEVIEPYHGAILDPACGSGGMFVHSAEFVRRHHKAPEREISLFGVEKMADTLRLCRLNLAVHGLAGDIREANSYYDDPHKLVGRFDFVMANPPFNQSEVDRAKLVNEAGQVDARFPFSAQIEALLDARVESVAITAPIISGDDRGGRVDLSDIDFEKLAKLFQQKPKTANEKLRSTAEKKARDLASRNPTRVHLVDKLEKLVEAYNLGTLDAEAFFEALKKLIAQMEEEERRAAREGLTEEELAIFDLLTRPEPKLTKAQEVEVKKVARELLQKLQDQLLVVQWRQKPQLRAAVQSEIRFKLNELPEEPYPQELWDEKVETVWQFVYHHMPGPVEVGATVH